MKINITNIMNSVKSFVNEHKKAVIIAGSVIVVSAVAIGVGVVIANSDNDKMDSVDTTITEETTVLERETGITEPAASTDIAVEEETAAEETTWAEDTTIIGVSETEPEATDTTEQAANPEFNIPTTTPSETFTDVNEIAFVTSTAESYGVVAREPLPDGVVCGYSWLECIARAATEDELRAFQKEKGYADDMIWCEHCGRPVYAMSVEGKLMVCGAIYGTCERHFSGGDWTCRCCGATIPVDTCHTCGVPVEITPLPGTAVDSPDQLTAAHKEYLRNYAKTMCEGLYGGKDNETFISIYTFVLTDKTAISSKSKCLCFFIFTSEKEYSETPVFHTGEIFDISILDNGSIAFRAQAEEFTTYENETSAATSYEKIGHSIIKIS